MVTVRSRFGGRGGGVVRSRGSLWAARASLRAAVTAAVAGGVCPGRVVGRWVRSAAGGGGGLELFGSGGQLCGPRAVRFVAPPAVAGGVCPGRVVGRWVRSAAGGGEGLELLERGEQLCGPWPVVLEAQLAAPAVECEPTGDVQQPVAQPFGLGLGELAVEQQRLGPDDQIVREQHDLQPQLVERERLERELRKARVLVVADAVLDMGALAVAALDDRGVLVGLVGEDRLEAEAVVVGEGKLRAGVRALAPNDHARALRPGAQLDAVGDL